MLKHGEPQGRVRAVVALFAGAAMMSAAMATSSVVGTLVVADLLGTGWGACRTPPPWSPPASAPSR